MLELANAVMVKGCAVSVQVPYILFHYHFWHLYFRLAAACGHISLERLIALVESVSCVARRASRCMAGPDITALLGVSKSACAGSIAAVKNSIDTWNSITQEE